MSWLEVAATARLTRLVTEDEITRPVRDSIEELWPDSKLTYAVNCPYCVSIWAAAVVQILPQWLVRTLAMSAGYAAVLWVRDVAEGVTQ